MNKPTTVAQLIDEYLADGSLVDGSSAFSAQLVRKLEVCKGWIGEECINAITSSRLQKMLQDGHVFYPGEYKLFQAALHALFEYAKECGCGGVDGSNPVDELFPVEWATRLRGHRPPELGVRQFNAILENADDWLRDLLLLAVITGLDYKDVCSLKFEQIKKGSLFYQPEDDGEDVEIIATEYILCEDLIALVNAARRRPPLSPFVVSRANSQRSMAAHERVHRTQISPAQARKYFNVLVNRLKNSQPELFGGQVLPTIESVRQLSRSLYEAVDVSNLHTLARFGECEFDLMRDYMDEYELDYFPIHVKAKLLDI